MSPTTDERVVELETQLTFQQQILDTLNDVVTRQVAQIDALERKFEQITASLQLGGGTTPDGADEPPPPHY